MTEINAYNPLIAFVRSFATGYRYICDLEKTTDPYALAAKVRESEWIMRLNRPLLDLRQNNIVSLPGELAALDKVEEIRLPNTRLGNMGVLKKMASLRTILFSDRTSCSPKDL